MADRRRNTTGARAAFAVAIACSLAAHLRAEVLGLASQVYAFKPLTTSLLVAYAAWVAERARAAGAARGRGYAALVLAGLCWSLLGDVLLMLPGDRFLAGLVSFLVAHACYTAAFVRTSGWLITRLAWVYAAYLACLLLLLGPHVGSLLGPVALYGLVLMTMGWQAAEAWRSAPSPASRAAAAGALLFIVSDSLLAWGRFVSPLPLAPAWVMTTYVAAQWGIASSISD